MLRGVGSTRSAVIAKTVPDSEMQSGQTGQSAGLCGAAGAWSDVSCAWQIVVASAMAARSAMRGTVAAEANCATSASSANNSPEAEVRRWLMTQRQHTESRCPSKSSAGCWSLWSPTRHIKTNAQKPCVIHSKSVQTRSPVTTTGRARTTPSSRPSPPVRAATAQPPRAAPHSPAPRGPVERSRCPSPARP
jgi:hypothetical protein